MSSSSTPGIPVAGLGMISRLGRGRTETLAALYDPDDRKYAPAPPSARIVPVLDPPVFEVPGFTDGGNRTLALAEYALREALADAHLEPEDLAGTKTGICVGTTVANHLNDLTVYRDLRQGQMTDYDRAGLVKFAEESPADHLARKYAFDGPRAVISNACASGADAIGLAAKWIQAGYCELAVAVGAEELNHVPVAGFYVLGISSRRPCTPFDRNRSGLNLGEGAGVVILESEAHAARRGFRPEFELSGYGISSDIYHLTAPHPDGAGLIRAMRMAFAEHGHTPAEAAFVNAHGTGTHLNDLCEGNALASFFGPSVRYFSTKGRTGHTLGAAGALEGVFTLLMLREGRIPASYGYHDRPDDLAVPPVSRETRLAPDAAYALSTSLAFGGSNAALLFGKRK